MKTHISWQLAAVSFGILIGTAASQFWPNLGLPIILAVGLLCLAAWRRSRAGLVIACLAGVIFGLASGSVVMRSIQAYQPFFNQTVMLTGKVADDPTLKPGGEQSLYLTQALTENQKLPGKVLVTFAQPGQMKRGDLLIVKGRLTPGFGTIPAAIYKAGLVKTVTVKHGDVAREVRDWFNAGVHRSIPDPQGSLAVGFLTGQHSNLPEDLARQLRTLGLTHIVVASGYNLTILVRLARRLLARVSKYLAAASGMAMIAGFTLVTGFNPSMSRAGLVAGMSLLAWYYGRRIHPVILLSVAAAVTVVINPSYAWGDVGWCLSFASFAGVMMLAPLVERYFWAASHKPPVLRQVLIETVCAQLATLPIIAFVFGQYSPLAVPANLLILPLIPLAMLLTFVTGVGAVISPNIGSILGWPATWLLRYMTSTAKWLAALPWAQGEIAIDAAMLVTAYVVLLIIGVRLWRKTGYRFLESSVIE